MKVRVQKSLKMHWTAREATERCLVAMLSEMNVESEQRVGELSECNCLVGPT